MSKKRGRSTAASKADEGPDTQFAEELLFQLASDDNEPQNPPPAKRGKSKSTSAKILVTSTSKDDSITDLTGADLDDNATTTAEGDESTSTTPQDPSNGKHPAAIRPSSSLRHCDGFDVVRKGSRGRGRQLMVLPGALGLGGGSAGGTAGVKLGMLNTAIPGCPVLYVEFPEGRLKCTGRTVHTKGRFFTLYADKVADRATRMDCRDVFDSVVFFGKACWVGKKEDNPEDEPLPLPDSLHFLQAEEEEAPGNGEPALKTHFGGGNPKSLLAGSKEDSSKKPKNGVAGADPEEAEDEGENEEEDGESAAAAAAAAEPARRSGRSTKSTATYVEDSDDSENDDDGGSSSSGSDDEGDGDGGERKGGPNFSKVTTTENGKGRGKGGGAAKDGVEVFSILDAPTAKRKPVTIGSGKVESAKKTPAKKKGGGKNGPMSSGKGKGKGRRAADGSSVEDGSSGGSSDEGGVEVVAEPSRRSSRASAVSKVKYTQSSGSEEEEEEEDEDEDDEEDF